MNEWRQFNKESLYLGSVIAVISGPLFALTHEGTKWLIFYIKDRFWPK